MHGVCIRSIVDSSWVTECFRYDSRKSTGGEKMFFTEEDKLMHGMLCNNVYSLRGLLQVDKNKKGFEQTHAKE